MIKAIKVFKFESFNNQLSITIKVGKFQNLKGWKVESMKIKKF